ncbi:MAG TPA: hypothetical protein VFX06_05550 [Stellaceae bacterium]|nr:hypothetical protein [Stellaceae bacterium]
MSGSSRSWWWRVAAGFSLIVLTAWAAPPASAQFAAAQPARVAAVPPIPAGDARLWFYRPFMVEDTQTVPTIFANGAPIGYGGPGTSFYRDVPAGPYHLAVTSVGRDVNQDQNVEVAPGDQVYVKIASNPGWDEGGDRSVWRRPTYYVMIVPPGLAALEMPFTSFTSDGA